jgi:hypothetical protein
LIATETRVLGAGHAETLRTRIRLARTWFDLGNRAQGEQEFRQVLTACERALGPDHPDTLTACYNLAVCLEAQDKIPDALTYARRTLTIRLKVLGKDHPKTKSTQEMVNDLIKKYATA